MTDDDDQTMTGTIVEERPPDVPEPAAGSEVAVSSVARERLRTRVLLPLAIPLGAALTLAVLAFNLSRVFLAGGKLGALIMATIVTLSVLGGAAWISAKPALRTSSLTLIGSLVVLVVVGAGLTTLGAADDHGEEATGYVEPEGEPGAVVETTALGSLDFDPSALAAPAGIIEIRMEGAPGAGFHDLVFDGAFQGFELRTDGPNAGKIEAEAGEYVFYCSVPGHRSQGMEGTLTVTAAGDGDGGGADEPGNGDEG